MRLFVAFTVALVSIQTARGETYSLTELPRDGDCVRVSAETTLAGALNVNRDGKAVALRIAAKNEHALVERMLSASARKSLRFYSTARSIANVDGERVTRELNPDRRLVIASRSSEGLFCHSPTGAFTRTDLEVVSEHFETLSVTGLLPTKEVAVDDTWKVDDFTAQSVCLFDGLISHELTGKLREVSAGVAVIAIEGKAKGIESGAMVSLTVAATLRFDVAKAQIVAIEWKQKDTRDQGPATPGAEIETTTIVKRERLAEPPGELADSVVKAATTGEPPPAVKLLLHRDPKNRFQFLHSRDWHLVGQTDHHLVLRLIDRGEFVAQATITSWENAGKGKHLSPADFEALTAKGSTWKQEDVIDRTEVPTDADRWVYRITARGELDGTKVVQTFYIAANANGDQMIMTFTMKPNSVTRIGTRDLEIVNGIEFGKK